MRGFLFREVRKSLSVCCGCVAAAECVSGSQSVEQYEEEEGYPGQ